MAQKGLRPSADQPDSSWSLDQAWGTDWTVPIILYIYHPAIKVPQIPVLPLHLLDSIDPTCLTRYSGSHRSTSSERDWQERQAVSPTGQWRTHCVREAFFRAWLALLSLQIIFFHILHTLAQLLRTTNSFGHWGPKGCVTSIQMLGYWPGVNGIKCHHSNKGIQFMSFNKAFTNVNSSHCDRKPRELL